MVDYNCVSNLNSTDSIQKINETVKSYFVSNYSNTNTEYETKQINEAFTVIAEKEFQDLKDEKSIRIYEVLKKLNAQEDFSSYEKKYAINTKNKSIPKKNLKPLFISLLAAGVLIIVLSCFAAFKYAQSTRICKAAEWWQKAAAQGDARAQRILGVCYYNGEGVSKDVSKAAEWWQKAAAQGDARAQRNLGMCYYNGEGVSKDVSKAAEWYQKAAAQGDARAQCNLGVCYYNGEGVSKDVSKAVEWYQKAADQGDAQAQYNLGVLYYNGEGVSKDVSKAAEWWQKAADQGDASAQQILDKLK